MDQPTTPLTALPSTSTLESLLLEFSPGQYDKGEEISLERKKVYLSTYKIYECHYCGILYEDAILHDIHMIAHCSGNPFKCVCGFDAFGFINPLHFFTIHLAFAAHELPSRYTSTNPPGLIQFPAPGTLGTPPISAETRQNWDKYDTLYECRACRILFKDYFAYNMHKLFHSYTEDKFRWGLYEKYKFNLDIYMRPNFSF